MEYGIERAVELRITDKLWVFLFLVQNSLEVVLNFSLQNSTRHTVFCYRSFPVFGMKSR